MFKGVYTALITPFKNGEVDLESLESLVEFQLSQGIEGLVVNGTTAESPTLSYVEVVEIFEFIKKKVAGKVPLVLGAGSNSTSEVVKTIHKYNELKPDGFLSVVPYYNKPQQRGIVEHYKQIAQAAKYPVIAYNVPGRTVVSTSSETISQLSKIENIVAIKEASGDMTLAQEVIASTHSSFTLISGDDGTAMNLNSLGGQGIISVISHILPKETVALRKSAEKKQSLADNVDFKRFNLLNDVLYIEPNPVPVKYSLYKMGIIKSAEVRLPLVEMLPENKMTLDSALKQAGLI